MTRRLSVAAVVVALWAAACGAQPDRTSPAAAPGQGAATDAMAKGPAAAPVTIVEFSDYQ